MLSRWDLMMRPHGFMWHPGFERSLLSEGWPLHRDPRSVEAHYAQLFGDHTTDYDEFFKDIDWPTVASDQNPQAASEEQKNDCDETTSTSTAPSFNSYSYEKYMVVDDQGRRIVKKRRRYEDSSGQLKEEQERSVGDHSLKVVRRRAATDQELEEKLLFSDGVTPEAFEMEWESTPLAEKKAIADAKMKDDQSKALEDVSAADATQ